MQKKVTAVLLALLLTNVFLFAQIADEADVVSIAAEEAFQQAKSANVQIQHIQWQNVKRAKGYAIDLQQKVNGIWTDLDSFEIEEPEFDFVLEPGFYRFRISALNTLGRRGSSSDWAEFELVGAGQPVLHRQSFPDSAKYGVPVLTRSIDDENGTEVVAIRGINCFSADTSFSLVPSDSYLEDKPFHALTAQTKVQLPVVGSDTVTNTIRLSVDWSRLVPGYYNLLVEKKTGETDAFEVLVQPERIPQFTIDSSSFDPVINADCLDVVHNDGVIVIDAGTTQYDTVFTLEPATDTEYPYPFATGAERVSLPAEWVSFGDGKITIQVDSSQVKPGWYTLYADTPEAGVTGYDVLVENYDDLSTLPEIADVSGKINRKTLTISLTIKTQTALFSGNDTNSVKAYFISQKDELFKNNRIPLHMMSVAKNGKSAEFEVSASSLPEGDYALMLETAESSRIAYVHVTSKFQVELTQLDDADIKERFLKTPNAELAAELAAQRALAEAEGMRMVEDLPAFNSPVRTDWYWTSYGQFPADLSFTADSLNFSVINKIPDKAYSSEYKLLDDETLDMLRSAEGFSFESMVTKRNNGWTKWRLAIQTSEGLTEIPLNSKLGQLSQTVVIWEDYKIDPATIQGVRYVVDAKMPADAGWTNSLEVYQAKTYSSAYPVKQLYLKNPLLFTKTGAFVGFNLDESPAEVDSSLFGSGRIYDIDDRLSDSGVPSFMYLSLFDAGWFTVNAVYAPAGMGSGFMFGIEDVLALPNNWFEPYASFGYLYNGNMMWQEVSVGVVLLKYMNFRFMMIDKSSTLGELGFITSNTTLQNTEVNWSTRWLQFGVELPLRKQIIKYVEPTDSTAKEPVLFNELHFGITGSIVDSSTRPYLYYLDDYFAGVRLVGFKYFALDASVSIRDTPVKNMKNYGALDFSADMKFMLPLFKDNFTLFAGLGAGYNAGNYNPGNFLYVSSEAGIKFGKYLSVSFAGKMPESKFDEFCTLAEEAPILSPGTLILSSEYTLRVTVTLPLRTKK